MIYAGIDVGSTTTKAVILDGEEVVGSALLPSADLPGKTALAVYEEALRQAGAGKSDVQAVATTGYGRRLTDLGTLVMTEIKACAAGALACGAPGGAIHTVIDVGGQDTKVISIDNAGEIDDFSMNDKCAAGTGRFLEVLARRLELSYEEFVSAALTSHTMLQMNATCAVFAESEVVGMLARGIPKADIAAAAHNAIAARIASMVRRVGHRGVYSFVGGGARNQALAKALEESLGASLHVPLQAQLVIALGAAVGARRKCEEASGKGAAGV
ncbi:MAG: acyl-CoA dehydratase activase [Planctomycetota bacterium]